MASSSLETYIQQTESAKYGKDMRTAITGLAREVSNQVEDVKSTVNSFTNSSNSLTNKVNTLESDNSSNKDRITALESGIEAVADWSKYVNGFVPTAMINTGDLVDGYLDSSGGIASQGATTLEKCTDYIAIREGDIVVIDQSKYSKPWVGLFFYDKSKTKIGSRQNSESGTCEFTAPANAYYVRVSYRTYGEPLKAFIGIRKSKNFYEYIADDVGGGIDNVRESINEAKSELTGDLANVAKYINYVVPTAMINTGDLVDGYLNDSGSLSTQDSTLQEKCTDYIAIREGDIVVIDQSKYSNPWVGLCFYDETKTKIGSQQTSVSGTCEFTAPVNAYYVRVSYRTYGEPLKAFVGIRKSKDMYDTISEFIEDEHSYSITGCTSTNLTFPSVFPADSEITLTLKSSVPESDSNIRGKCYFRSADDDSLHYVALLQGENKYSFTFPVSKLWINSSYSPVEYDLSYTKKVSFKTDNFVLTPPKLEEIPSRNATLSAFGEYLPVGNRIMWGPVYDTHGVLTVRISQENYDVGYRFAIVLARDDNTPYYDSGWISDIEKATCVQDGCYFIVVKRTDDSSISKSNISDLDLQISYSDGFQRKKLDYFDYLNDQNSAVSLTDSIDDAKEMARTPLFTPFANNRIYSHYFINKIGTEEASNNVIIPSQSLDDVRFTARLGVKFIELNVHATATSGKYVVTHGNSGKLGYELYDPLGTDISQVEYSETSFDTLKTYRYRAKYEKYRKPLASLDEMLYECRKYGIAPMLSIPDDTCLNLVKSIMGNNFIWYNGNRAKFKGMIMKWYGTYTDSQVLDDCNSIGAPFMPCIDSTYEKTDAELTSLIYEVHKKGCHLGFAETYVSRTESERLLRLGFDFAAGLYSVNDFNEGDVFEGRSDLGFSDFETDGTVTDGVLTLSSGQYVKKSLNDVLWIGKGSLHVAYSGSLKIQMGEYINTVFDSNGESKWLSTYFLNSSPSVYLIAQADTTITDLTYLVKKC